MTNERDMRGPSHVLLDGPGRAPARAMLRATGLTDEDLSKPLIGIANTWIEIGPCNFHLRRLSAKVKEGIRAAGLVRGAYHFFEPNDDPTQQATHFLSTVQPAPGDLPPVLDVETTGEVSDSELWSGVAAWLELVERATGYSPILYTAPGFWDSHAPDLSLTRYPLWLADYADQPTLPDGWTSWLFWQYSQSGSCPGVTGAVDLDVFSGTLEQLQQFTHKSTT